MSIVNTCILFRPAFRHLFRKKEEVLESTFLMRHSSEVSESGGKLEVRAGDAATGTALAAAYDELRRRATQFMARHRFGGKD